MNQLSPTLKHPSVLWTAAAVLLFVAVPWLITALVPSESGMAACIFLFFAADPVFAIAAGMAAGRNVKQLWFLPFLIPTLFMAGTWLSLEFGELDFVTYAFMYFLLSAVTMLVFLMVIHGRPKS